MAGVKFQGQCAHVKCCKGKRRGAGTTAHDHACQERVEVSFHGTTLLHLLTSLSAAACDWENRMYCVAMQHDGVLHGVYNRAGVSEPFAGLWSQHVCTHLLGQLSIKCLEPVQKHKKAQ